MKSPTIIVTGGAGFIGSAVCRYLVSNHIANVVNVDALTYAANLTSLDSIKACDQYTLVEANICDADAMRQVFDTHQPDGMIHLAAESHVDRSITGAQVFIQTNIVGTSVLLDVALAYWKGLSEERSQRFKFLHVSTDEVYGSLGVEGLFHEETVYAPSSPYSASKAASDHLVLAWHRTYGLPVVISNCSNNYGAYQFPEKLIPLVIINAIGKQPLPIYGDGLNIRDWLHVDDHAKALWLIFERGRSGEKYNVGGGNEKSNVEVVHHICSLLDDLVPSQLAGGYSSLIKFVSDRPGHDARYAIDASKLENEIGWNAEQCFSSGLKQTVEWYLSNEKWWRPLVKQ